MGVVVVGSAFSVCLPMTLAGLVRNRDRLMGIGQAITMPLFFASNALYPVDVVPPWLRWLSAVNPLSYEVNALRGLLIATRRTRPWTSSSSWWRVSPWPRLCCAVSCGSGRRDGRKPVTTVAHRPERMRMLA